MTVEGIQKLNVRVCKCGRRLQERETDCEDCVRKYLEKLVESEQGILLLRDFIDENDLDCVLR